MTDRPRSDRPFPSAPVAPDPEEAGPNAAAQPAPGLPVGPSIFDRLSRLEARIAAIEADRSAPVGRDDGSDRSVPADRARADIRSADHGSDGAAPPDRRSTLAPSDRPLVPAYRPARPAPDRQLRRRR